MKKHTPEDLMAELRTAQVSADAAVKRLQQLVGQVAGDIRMHELRLQANQRTMRLMIALSGLIDEAGENRDVFWERGLVSREQYDALAQEFRQIGISAGLDGCKWTERCQCHEALLEILEEYREGYRR